jgi:hypothetical protein
MLSKDKVYSSYNCAITWSIIESNTFTLKLDLVSKQAVTSLMILALSAEKTKLHSIVTFHWTLFEDESVVKVEIKWHH